MLQVKICCFFTHVRQEKPEQMALFNIVFVKLSLKLCSKSVSILVDFLWQVSFYWYLQPKCQKFMAFCGNK